MTFPETERVLYGKSPLASVICHFHFSAIAKIVEPPMSFKDRVREPFAKYAKRFGAGLPSVPSSSHDAIMNLIANDPDLRRATTAHEFASEDDVWQISLMQTALIVTCRKYQRWEDFKRYVLIALQALLDIYAPDGFFRVGLRYQDVVHRSYLGIADAPWAELLQSYITGELSAGIAEGRVEKKLSETLIQLDAPNTKVFVHHGLAETEGSSETGYIIDSDFYAEQTEPRMEATDAVIVLDDFNREARRFFRWCITDKLYRALEPQRIESD